MAALAQGQQEMGKPSRTAVGAVVGACLALAVALAGASYAAVQWPLLPVAGLAGALMVAWCCQRPSRWVYLLVATIFFEARDMSLYVVGTRVRPAQILLLPAAATAALFAVGGLIKLRRIPLLVPLLLYLGCNLVSTCLSVAFRQSLKIFLLLTSLVVLYALVYTLVRNDPTAWPSIFRFFVLIGALQIGYGLYQVAAGWANARLGTALPIGWRGLAHVEYLGLSFGRPYGTLPEPDTYGAVCVFYALLLGLMWLTSSGRLLPGGKLFLAGGLAVAGLLIGFVRASWFGFLVGAVCAVWLGLSRRIRQLRLVRLVGATMLALLVATAALGLSPELRRVVARRFSPRAGETALGPQNVRFRQMAESFRNFKRRPVFGNGPGSFTIIGTVGAHEEYYETVGADLARMYDPSLLTTVLNDTGLVGAVAFLLVVASYFGHVRRRVARMADRRQRNASLAGHCALLGLFASFVFTHYFWMPFTWLFLATVMLLLEINPADERDRTVRPA